MNEAISKEEIIEKAREKFTKARISLLQTNPFFSFLALSTKPSFEENVDRIAISIDGTIYVNPEWFSKLQNKVAITAITHEIGHLVMDSFNRLNGRNPKLWNIASDQTINEMLVNNNFDPIPEKVGGWVLKEEWKGLTADEIYDLLEKEQSDMDSFDEMYIVDDETGEIKDNNGNTVGKITKEDGSTITPDDIKKWGEYWKEQTKEAEVFVKNAGGLPDGIERIINDVYKPKYSLRAIIERYITNIGTQKNWRHIDKKHSQNVIFPYERSEKLKVGIAIDTSGSMDEKDIAKIKGAIINLCNIVEDVDIDVVEFDAEIQDTYKITRQNVYKFLKKTTFKGGGGTCINPVIEYFEKKNCNALLVFSDLDFFDAPKKTNKVRNILWFCTYPANYRKKMLVGKVYPL